MILQILQILLYKAQGPQFTLRKLGKFNPGYTCNSYKHCIYRAHVSSDSNVFYHICENWDHHGHVTWTILNFCLHRAWGFHLQFDLNPLHWLLSYVKQFDTISQGQVTTGCTIVVQSLFNRLILLSFELGFYTFSRFFCMKHTEPKLILA